MTEGAEEFDRTRALRRVAFHREIPTASLEGYWQRWDAPGIRNDSSTAPAVMADEYAALVSGEAVLQLPDGSRWISLAALCSTDVEDAEGPGDNDAWLQRLTRDLWAHQARRDHRDLWLPAVMLNAATLDPTRGFCTDCRSWVDLAAEDAEADRVETERLIEPLEN
jgi:hypothetical protein